MPANVPASGKVTSWVNGNWPSVTVGWLGISTVGSRTPEIVTLPVPAQSHSFWLPLATSGDENGASSTIESALTFAVKATSWKLEPVMSSGTGTDPKPVSVPGRFTKPSGSSENVMPLAGSKLPGSPTSATAFEDGTGNVFDVPAKLVAIGNWFRKSGLTSIAAPADMSIRELLSATTTL